MPCPDDMEKAFLKVCFRDFLRCVKLVVVKHTFFAGAGWTYISARVAADAAAEFIFPEFRTFVCGHIFKTVKNLKTL